MTKEAFAKLAGAGVILLDGATGSNLTRAGMPKGIRQACQRRMYPAVHLLL